MWAWYWILATVIVLAGIAVGLYFLLKSDVVDAVTPGDVIVVTPTPTPSARLMGAQF